MCACACWKLKWNPGNVRKNHGCLRGGSSFSTTLRPKNGTEPLWVLFFFFSIEAAVVYVRDEAKRENQNFRIN